MRCRYEKMVYVGLPILRCAAKMSAHHACVITSSPPYAEDICPPPLRAANDMPLRHGRHACQRLWGHCAIIIITPFDDDSMALLAMRAAIIIYKMLPELRQVSIIRCFEHAITSYAMPCSPRYVTPPVLLEQECRCLRELALQDVISLPGLFFTRQNMRLYYRCGHTSHRRYARTVTMIIITCRAITPTPVSRQFNTHD